MDNIPMRNCFGNKKFDRWLLKKKESKYFEHV